ncbi:MAG: PorV/PorQ family protein [Bacteroidota bacterium]
MKNILLFLCLMCVGASLTFGQSERTGQAGATELMINTMPRSSAFNGLDVSSSDGIESSWVNPAGIARTTGTELMFSHTWWLIGTEIQVNSFGFSQSLGESGSLGLLVNAFDLGDFIRTTEELPDGTLGTFSPTYLNIGLSYAKKFTDRIHVGFTARVISESTPEVVANGVAFDAGIQYRAGEKDRVKLGIVLRNVGPTMKFGGDGLSFRVPIEPDDPFSSRAQVPTASFELPTMLSMGGSYDFFIGDDNTVTILGGFISNSFYVDQGGLGLAYKYKDYLILRGSFLYENGIFGKVIGVDGRTNAHTGYAAGATFQVPFGTGKFDASGNEAFSTFSLDASYRTSNPFGGTLVIGARIDL